MLSVLVLYAGLYAQEQVYLTPDKALELAMPEAAAFKIDTMLVSGKAASALDKKLFRNLEGEEFYVHKGFDKENGFLGYAIITEEKGKFMPITFMVAVTPAMEVDDVEVLVYRESRGGEVRMKRFLRQYKRKSSADRIRINRDIINVTGATISVIALNIGVRKVLALLEYYYPYEPGILSSDDG